MLKAGNTGGMVCVDTSGAQKTMSSCDVRASVFAKRKPCVAYRASKWQVVWASRHSRHTSCIVSPMTGLPALQVLSAETTRFIDVPLPPRWVFLKRRDQRANRAAIGQEELCRRAIKGNMLQIQEKKAQPRLVLVSLPLQEQQVA